MQEVTPFATHLLSAADGRFPCRSVCSRHPSAPLLSLKAPFFLGSRPSQLPILLYLKVLGVSFKPKAVR